MAAVDNTTDLTASGITLESDSENYGVPEFSSSPEPSDASPIILYKPPTIWGLLRGAAINLILPFVNGLMLGFGELFAHEIAFRLGWSQTKVFPSGRSSRPIGPGIEVQSDSTEEDWQKGNLEDLTSLE